MERAIAGSPPRIIAGAAIYIPAAWLNATATTIMSFKDAGTVQVDFRVTSTGAIQITRERNATRIALREPAHEWKRLALLRVRRNDSSLGWLGASLGRQRQLAFSVESEHASNSQFIRWHRALLCGQFRASRFAVERHVHP
jgi:hypothetical protein